LIVRRLAKTFTVAAVDLRGWAKSAPSTSGYDAANLPEDITSVLRNFSWNMFTWLGTP
jgi:pimeloyl-ACP methyl ester carboxylesterase